MLKNHKRKYLFLTLAFLVIISAGCAMGAGKIKPPKNVKWETNSFDKVSVHDPSVESVINEDGEEEFYIFGSHIGQAKTKDFLTWEVPFMREYENMEDNILFGDTNENLKETFEWAGYDDADSAGGYNLWAPDVIYNEDFEWGNGETGAYLLYYSATSTWRRSAIVMLASQDIEGPYEYVDTIIYSGFTSVDSTDGSERNTNYEATNLPDLIDDGTISEFNEEWVRNNGREYNTDYAPNAIDPAAFYDENDQLWLGYGSWSGGIYLLELDPATGKPIYPGEDSVTEDGRVIDRYFGVKISGGYHQSGEGPFFGYDDETGYYYMWVTYGGLQSNGGYNMRLFRSEEATGPYVDMKGNTGIIEQGENNENYGIKLLGNYDIPGLKGNGYRAVGHNSVIKDKDGNWFNIFHTRFNTFGEEHEVRVHQMLRNSDDWLIPLPYQYSGDIAKIVRLEDKDILGEYAMVNHGTKNSSEMLDTLNIVLEEDGKISGDQEGQWAFDESGYLQMTINDINYDGFFTELSDEEDQIRTVFAAYGTDNDMIWGIKN